MTQEEVLPRLKKLLTDRLRVAPDRTESLGPDSLLLEDGLGLDSLDCIELLLGIEEEFDLEFSEEEEGWIEHFSTLGSISQLILDSQGEYP